MQVVATKLRVYNSDVTSSCREYDCSDAQLNDSDRELMSTLARKPGHDLKKGCVSIAWMTKDMSDVRHLYASLSAQSQNLRFDKDTIKTLSNAWECDGDVSGVFIPIRTGPYRHILAIPATCICDSEIRGALMHAGCQGDDGQVCGVKLTLMEKEKKRYNMRLFKKAFALLFTVENTDYNALIEQLGTTRVNAASGDDEATHTKRRAETSPPHPSKRPKQRESDAYDSIERLISKIYDTFLAHVEAERVDRERVLQRLAQLEQMTNQWHAHDVTFANTSELGVACGPVTGETCDDGLLGIDLSLNTHDLCQLMRDSDEVNSK